MKKVYESPEAEINELSEEIMTNEFDNVSADGDPQPN